MRNRFFPPRFLISIAFLFVFIDIYKCENVVKKSIDESIDTGEANDESKDESLELPVENDTVNLTCTRRANSQMHDIRNAQHRQFPFMAAVVSQQNEYLCSGAVISNGLVITTAKCTLQPVSHVILNATKAVRDETTPLLHAIKTDRFPTYSGVESVKDVGLIYTEKHNNSVATKIRLSNYSSARNLFDVEGVGFGLNAETGQPKELQYVGMELRSPLEGDVLQAYIDCIDTKVPTCFRDTGGPVIYDNELVGIVSAGQEECTRAMTSTYAVNKRMAKIVPTYAFRAWLDEKIKKNEEQDEHPLVVYPLKPNNQEERRSYLPHRITSDKGDVGNSLETSPFVICSLLFASFII